MRRQSGPYSRNYSWGELIENGVKFVYGANEHNCYIDSATEIGSGTIIYPGIILDSKTKIGKNCIVEGKIVESEIGDDCEIGKFAEVKRAKLARGVKAKHTCGIRDADIGPLTNIASSTDIKNYDGVEKFKTIIGSKCFLAGTIIGGVKIGDEVRIHPEAFVKENLPSMSYYAYGKIKEYRSWYLEGYYPNLDLPIPYLNRLHFMRSIEKKLGYKFHDGEKPIDENLKKYLNTPNQHLGGLAPLRALEQNGCQGILCVLGECDHFGKSQKKQEPTP